MSLVELEKEVQNLTPGEFSAFTRWLDEYASQKWEDQFATDVKEGKLDALGKKPMRLLIWINAQNYDAFRYT